MSALHRYTPGAAVVNRDLSTDGIRAVGFDLDHTLAVYDDDVVNRVACDEAAHLLVRDARTVVGQLEEGTRIARVARGLVLEHTTGAVVKLDATRTVRRAVLDGRHLDAQQIRRNFPGPVDLGNAHAIHSPFDLPTAWLYMALGRSDLRAARHAPHRVCRDVRTLLDQAHTRGALKGTIMADLPRFVRPLADARSFARLHATGRKLFVLTNSALDYATTLLDYLFDGRNAPPWTEFFDVVAVSAGKPAFFAPAGPPDAAGARSGHTSNAGDRPATDRVRGVVIDGGSADEVERILGVAPQEIFYAGDHAVYDVAAASTHGWRTGYVLPELGGTGAHAWGSALEEDGSPTWLAALAREHADVCVERVEHLVAPFENGAFVRDTQDPARRTGGDSA